MQLKTKPKILHHLRNVLLLIIGNSVSYLNSANIISDIGNCGDGLEKKLKIKQDKDVCPKLLRFSDFVLRFRAGAGSFLL